MNVEEGSEQAISRGDAVNEHVYDMIDVLTGGPNLSMESHFDYGTRAGYWRIARVLERYGATCTLNACSEALALSPWLGLDAIGRGSRSRATGIMAQLEGNERAEEREWIQRAVKLSPMPAACGPSGGTRAARIRRTPGGC